MRYGVPYKGSKNKIAEKIINFLLHANNFYDLFAGGCAITHCALLSNKWKTIHASDINYMPIDLFLGSIEGRYGTDKRWISREEFNAKKDTDPVIKYCWSFGNNGIDYLYGKDIEETKRKLHELVVNKGYNIHEANERLQAFERLEGLARLQRLQSLQSLQSLQASYSDVIIEPNSIIYCDIPYRDTACDSYNGFDHDSFYEWALKQTQPIFISEYNMPDDFIKVCSIYKRQLSTAYGSTEKVDDAIWTTREVAKEIPKQLTIWDLMRE